MLESSSSAASPDVMFGRRLLFTSAGDRTVFWKHWLVPNRPRCDIWACYYGERSDDPYKLVGIDYYSRHKGSKFQNLYDLYHAQTKIFRRYDYVLVLDDDFIISPGDINKLFDYAARYKTWILGPAHHPDGKITYSIHKPRRNIRARFTSFVEVNASLFSSWALEKFMTDYRNDGSLYDCGIENLWLNILGIRSDKYMIVDDVYCVNPHLRPDGCRVRECDIMPHKERQKRAREIYNKYNLRKYPIKTYDEIR